MVQASNERVRGFTLIEVLLTVAIISVITIVSAPVYLGFQKTNELDVATNTLVQYLYQAQSYSRAEAHDCSWGVTINGQNLTLFCGNSYASRSTAFDNVYNIPASISVTTNLEQIYSKLYGMPTITGSYNLSTTSGQTSSVTINAKGMLEY